MAEIRKILSILKARWPEVSLILFLPLLEQIIVWIVPLLSVRYRDFPTQTVMCMLSIFIFLNRSILIFLSVGFLRTVYLHDCKRQSIPVLFKTGWHFFLRMFLFECVRGVPFLIFSLLITSLLAKHISPQAFLKVMPMIDRLYYTGFHLILIKITLLIPALIIVLDCGFLKSFTLLKNYKLSKAKLLIILFLAYTAIQCFGWLNFQLGLYLDLALLLTKIFVVQFIFLMIGVAAVRFVASVRETE